MRRAARAALATVAVVAALALVGAGQAGSSSPTPVAGSADVDAILARMSVRDKVGQLFMLGFPGSDAANAFPVLDQLRAGGVLLTTNVSDAAAAQTLTAALQAEAKSDDLLPVLISVNHEGGDVQPITGGMTVYGPQWELGQLKPLSDAVAAARQRGQTHGRELSAIGISMNLAPDLDVWDNPANTVIGERSFSDDPSVAGQLGAAYIQGLQQQGVLAVGKHFPGHGSSAEDSHQTLPVVLHDRAWLDAHELVPFRSAIQAHVAAIMVGHLSFPLIDPAPNRPSSLSPVFVSSILRNDLGYDGLVITDDLGGMKAITAGYTPGTAAVQAFVAGSDMLLSVGPLDTEQEMVQAITDAVGPTISMQRLDASVRRILLAKAQAGLLAAHNPA